jgi:hypothetical protein
MEILEHRDRAEGRLRRLAVELDALRLVRVEVAPEIIGVEEEEYAPARLVADTRGLRIADPACEQQPGAAGRAGRLDDDPALVLFGHEAVLDEPESQLADVERERLVVVAHHERDESERLFHSSLHEWPARPSNATCRRFHLTGAMPVPAHYAA